MVVRGVYHERSSDSLNGLHLTDSGTLSIDATRFSYATSETAPTVAADNFRGLFTLATCMLMPVETAGDVPLRAARRWQPRECAGAEQPVLGAEARHDRRHRVAEPDAASSARWSDRLEHQHRATRTLRRAVSSSWKTSATTPIRPNPSSAPARWRIAAASTTRPSSAILHRCDQLAPGSPPPPRPTAMN